MKRDCSGAIGELLPDDEGGRLGPGSARWSLGRVLLGTCVGKDDDQHVMPDFDRAGSQD